MLSKELNDRIQASRELALLPFVKSLFRLIPSDRKDEAVLTLASITKVSDKHAATKTHIMWTQKMLDFVEKYPQHGAAIDELLQYTSDSAAIELVIAGATQTDLDRWESDVKKLLNSD